MAGLATGILKNTTTTGVPSIAVAADFPTLNQSTTGNAATATALVSTTEDTQGFTYASQRQNMRGTISPASGWLMLYGFTAGVGRIITKLGVGVGGTAAVGVTHFQIGLYSVNTATGALTLVANTTDQTTGLTAVYNPYQVSLAANYTLVAGTRYMAAVVITATTMPILNAAAGSDDYGANAYVGGVQQRLCGYVTAQTVLPGTIADSAITNYGNSASVLMVM